MIDAHIHYVKSLNPDKLKAMIEELGLTGIALQCIPGPDHLPVEEDAFSFRKMSSVPVYIFGGIRRSVYENPERELSEALVEEAKRLMRSGCEGLKMLEGKPQIRKAHPIPDFDLPVWEAFWTYVEEERIPVFFHVNDPEEFWDVDKISQHALECGWLYDETFINNEEQYRQIMHVLKRHPKLRVVFPHFFSCRSSWNVWIRFLRMRWKFGLILLRELNFIIICLNSRKRRKYFLINTRIVFFMERIQEQGRL